MLTAVASHFGLGEVIACTPVVGGLMNPNWRLTTTAGVFAVKQLRDATPAAARRQQAVLPLLAAGGVPVPETSGAEVDGHYYVVARWMPGRHRAGSELSRPACRALGDLLARIHLGLAVAMPEAQAGPAGAQAVLSRAEAGLSRAKAGLAGAGAGRALPVPELPPVADRPRTVDDARTDLERLGRIAAGGRDDFDLFATAEIRRRRLLLDEVGGLRPADDPDVRPAGWTHGDLNDLNLLFDGDAVCGVLDWDRLGVRPYGLEVVRTATVLFEVGDLGRVADFAAGYRGRFDIGDEALRDAAHRRWWTLVTDTYFLRRHYDVGDPACDHLLRRSSEVLRWWTGHRREFDDAFR